MIPALIMPTITLCSPSEVIMDEPVKCACKSCQCKVLPDKGVVREGRIYCSAACAYECTEITCVCVHDKCEK